LSLTKRLAAMDDASVMSRIASGNTSASGPPEAMLQRSL